MDVSYDRRIEDSLQKEAPWTPCGGRILRPSAMMHAVQALETTGRRRRALFAAVLAAAWLGAPGWAERHDSRPDETTAPARGATQGTPKIDLKYLNIRLSAAPVEPPAEAITQVLPLEGVRAARPRVGPPPRAAILEDDARRRAIILTVGDQEEAPIQALVLTDLDLRPYLPTLARCSQARGCASDRRPGVGGLSCVALCLIEALR